MEGGDNPSLIEANKLMQLRVASIAEWGRKKKLGVPRWTPLNIARIGLPLTELMEGLEGIWRRESGRVKSLAYFYVALQELEAHGFNPKVIQLDAHRSGQKSMRELLDEADADAMRAMLAAEKGS